MAGLSYNNMVAQLVAALPELRERYERERGWLREDSSYMVYSFVLYKHIEALLRKPGADPELIRRAFGFLERLLTHPDARVADVATQSVCHAICEDEVVLQKAQRYMGPVTKKACADRLAG